ncbi:hypothetical protein [Corynebacterium sp. A21]|uniref:hypothetical protein n=1 Tax=Corynebacterium sp. A21 TaxID=3457318 RepID=UPI003FD33ABC
MNPFILAAAGSLSAAHDMAYLAVAFHRHGEWDIHVSARRGDATPGDVRFRWIPGWKDLAWGSPGKKTGV